MTFLLTDIVGSTQLWERAPAGMAAAMVVHDQIIDEAVGRCGGVVVRRRGEGDSRFAVFGRASDAAAAAVGVVVALRATTWDTPEPVRVRLGLHTGEVEVRDGDFYGTAVNLCARLRGLAHPGQVLMSETARLVGATPPPAVTLRDVGVHRLKGLRTAERVFQLCHRDLDDNFPTLESEGYRPSVPFPRPASSFLGRHREVSEVLARIEQGARLVTLTGPGGTGKTRLALEVTARLMAVHDVTAVWVALADVRDPSLVIPTIATTLGARGDLAEHIRDQPVVLLLDNLEQVIESAADLSALLSSCPRLTLLVTSRDLLRVQGETEYRVPPLDRGDAVALPPAGTVCEQDTPIFGATPAANRRAATPGRARVAQIIHIVNLPTARR